MDTMAPSARAWRLGTMTWVCRCGSPHREARVGRRSPPTRAGARGLFRRCAGCGCGCSRHGRSGIPSPQRSRWCGRRRSPWRALVIAAQGSHERDALGGAERQIEPCTLRCPNARPCAPLGRCRRRASGPPPRVGLSAGALGIGEAHQRWRRCGCRRPAAMWGCGFRARCSTPPARRRRAPHRG